MVRLLRLQLRKFLFLRCRILVKIAVATVFVVLVGSWMSIFSEMIHVHTEPDIVVTEEDVQAAVANLQLNIQKAKELLQNYTDESVDQFWNLKEKKYILIVSSWRTGSTFLSEPLSKHPSSFLHYEPLWHFGVRQIRSGKMAHAAIEQLKILLQCNYSNPFYNDVVANDLEGFGRLNGLTWESCVKLPNYYTCSEPDYLARACRSFPTVVAKTVRLRLKLTRKLLENPQFRRLKVVYLARDPRATMLSRYQTTGWCADNHPDCSEPQRLCNDMMNDLDAFTELSAEFPGRLMLVKYETLAAHPLETFGQIFNFSDLSYIPHVQDVIRKRTSRHVEGEASTFRVSSERIDRWMKELGPHQVDEIQRLCAAVFPRLGYQMV